MNLAIITRILFPAGMEITSASTLPRALAAQLAPADAASNSRLIRAATVEALIVAISSSANSPGARQAPSYSIELDVQGERVQANSTHAFPVGTRVLLRALGPTRVRVEQVLQQPASPRADAVRAALRQALPQQLPLRDMLLHAQRALVDPSLPGAVRDRLRQLLDALPHHEELQQAPGLRRALMQSGVFLEPRLRALLDGTGKPATPEQAAAGRTATPPAPVQTPSRGDAATAAQPGTAAARAGIPTPMPAAPGTPSARSGGATPALPGENAAPGGAGTSPVSVRATAAATPTTTTTTVVKPGADVTANAPAPESPATPGGATARPPGLAASASPPAPGGATATAPSAAGAPALQPATTTPTTSTPSASTGTALPTTTSGITAANAATNTAVTGESAPKPVQVPIAPATAATSSPASAAAAASAEANATDAPRQPDQPASGQPLPRGLSSASAAALAAYAGSRTGNAATGDGAETQQPVQTTPPPPSAAATRSVPEAAATATPGTDATAGTTAGASRDAPASSAQQEARPAAAMPAGRPVQPAPALPLAPSPETPTARATASADLPAANAAADRPAARPAGEGERAAPREPQPARASPAPATNAGAPEPLDRDIKGRLLDLLGTLRAFAPRTPAQGATGTPGSSPATPQPGTADNAMLVYTARGTLPPTPGTATALPSQMAPMAEGAEPESNRLARETLLRYVEGALARTHVHQLGSLPEARQGGDSTPVATWTMELPIANGSGFDLLELQVEDHGQAVDARNGTQRRWQVMMRIDIAALGALHALLQLRGQQLATTLWAERSATLAALNTVLDELGRELEAQGVSVERLECRLGAPEPRQLRRFGELLDIRT